MRRGPSLRALPKRSRGSVSRVSARRVVWPLGAGDGPGRARSGHSSQPGGGCWPAAALSLPRQATSFQQTFKDETTPQPPPAPGLGEPGPAQVRENEPPSQTVNSDSPARTQAHGPPCPQCARPSGPALTLTYPLALPLSTVPLCCPLQLPQASSPGNQGQRAKSLSLPTTRWP